MLAPLALANRKRDRLWFDPALNLDLDSTLWNTILYLSKMFIRRPISCQANFEFPLHTSGQMLAVASSVQESCCSGQ